MDPVPLFNAVIQGDTVLLEQLLSEAAEVYVAKIEEAEKVVKAAKKAAAQVDKNLKESEENTSDQEAKYAEEDLKNAAEKAEMEAKKAKRDWVNYQYQTDKDGNNLLHVAAKFGNVEVVKMIYEKLPKDLIRKKKNREGTPLHIAALHKNSKMVKFLLNLAEDLDKDEENDGSEQHRTAKIVNRSGNTVFHEAVFARNWEVIEAFTNWNKDVIFWKNSRKKSAIYIAAENGWKDMLDKLLIETQSTKKNLHKGPVGRTPVHAAITARSTDCIHILLEKMKRFIDMADDTGSNPLHYAASLGYSAEASCILKVKGSIAALHHPDNNGLNSIHIAASKGHVKIFDKIAECWPEVIDTLTEEEDQNVVHLAAKYGKSDLVQHMLDKVYRFEKLLNEKDIRGNTPLHLATENSHPEVVRILLIAGDKIDRKIINHEGLTALAIAEQRQMADKASLPQLLTLTTYRINIASLGRHSPSIEENKPTQIIKDYVQNHIKLFESLDIVAALIITVSFAAGITVPGGFTSDGPYRGMAVLLKKHAFDVFIICDSMAFYLSVIVNISARLANNIYLVTIASKISLILLAISLIMMAVAFAASLYSVILILDWLAIMILVMGGTFLLYIVFLLLLLGLRKVTWVSPHLKHSIWRLFMLTVD